MTTNLISVELRGEAKVLSALNPAELIEIECESFSSYFTRFHYSHDIPTVVSCIDSPLK